MKLPYALVALTLSCSALAAQAPIQGDPQAGESKAAVCAACHGVDGNSPAAEWPKLAGQHESYIVRHLKLFKTGVRENPVMLGFAAPLSEQDMHDLGAYFAQQRILPGVADERLYPLGERLYRGGDKERGIPACKACHGPTGRGNPGAAYPMLAGQHAQYTAAVLRQFRAGAAWGDARQNPNVPVMAQIAEQLTDQEIEALASFLEGYTDPRTSPSSTAQR